MPARGFEPRTLGLKGRCSAKLSYTGGGRLINPIQPTMIHPTAPARPAGAAAARDGQVRAEVDDVPLIPHFGVGLQANATISGGRLAQHQPVPPDSGARIAGVAP
jgi:hypothetical protein